MLPTAARRNHRRQAAITATVVLAVRKAWRRMRTTGSWADQWATDVGPKSVAVVVAGQQALAQESQGYMTAVLAELGIASESPTSLTIPTFSGVAGDGRPVATLLEQAVVRAGEHFNAQRNTDAFNETLRGRPPITEPDPALALESQQAFLDRVTATILADTARAAESVAMVQREWVEGWVRMLNPPSCSRCAILAGKFYLWNDGFERHPFVIAGMCRRWRKASGSGRC